MTPNFDHIKDPVVKARLGVLTHLTANAAVRAEYADVTVGELPSYQDGLRDLGLLDIGDRLTPAGSALVNIGLRRGDNGSPYLRRRDIWQSIGGDEVRLEKTLTHLHELGMIAQTEDGRYRVIGD